MRKDSQIGLSTVEKLLVILFPFIIGTLGTFLRVIVMWINNIPFIPKFDILNYVLQINTSIISIVFGVVGILAGIYLSITVYREALKISLKKSYIEIKINDTSQKILKKDISSVFFENKYITIIDNEGHELIREKSDIKESIIKETFLNYQYPWSEIDPYEKEFRLWKLEDKNLNEKTNSILYERRKAIRESDKKEIIRLKEDLRELNIVVKNDGENQYIRQV